MVPKKSKAEVATEIENFVIAKKCSYIDAVILYCEKNNIDVEQVASIISSNKILVAKLQLEAEDLNFLKKSARLDI